MFKKCGACAAEVPSLPGEVMPSVRCASCLVSRFRPALHERHVWIASLLITLHQVTSSWRDRNGRFFPAADSSRLLQLIFSAADLQTRVSKIMSDRYFDDRAVKRLWQKKSFPGSYSSASTFLREYLKAGYRPKRSLKATMKILAQIPVYSMTLRRQQRFMTRHVDYSVGSVGRDFQADLAHMPAFGPWHYFAVIVDVFDNYLVTFALKTKTAEEFREEFEKAAKKYNMLEGMSTMSTDLGGEFRGNADFFREKGVKLIYRGGRNKAFLAEDYVRIIKTKLLRAVRVHNTDDWVKYLGKG
jgi:hypothetical protein